MKNHTKKVISGKIPVPDQVSAHICYVHFLVLQEKYWNTYWSHMVLQKMESELCKVEFRQTKSALIEPNAKL